VSILDSPDGPQFNAMKFSSGNIFSASSDALVRCADDSKRHNITQRVQRDNSLPGAVLAAFAPLGGAWCSFGLRMRLKDG
jgi:hypothetical protein